MKSIIKLRIKNLLIINPYNVYCTAKVMGHPGKKEEPLIF